MTLSFGAEIRLIEVLLGGLFSFKTNEGPYWGCLLGISPIQYYIKKKSIENFINEIEKP